LIYAGEGHEGKQDVIVLKHNVLGLKALVVFIVIMVIRKREWNDALNNDLSKNDLPVASCPKCVILGDESLDIEPLEVNHVSQVKRYDMN
jgi:hypothetical protein